MTVPNTVVSVTGLEAILEIVLEVVGGLDDSTATGSAFELVVAVTVVVPGTERVVADDDGSA